MEPGLAHGRQFLVQRIVGVFQSPFVEVPVGAFLADTARNQVRRPEPIGPLTGSRMPAHGHVRVHEDAPGAQRPVDALEERDLVRHLRYVMQRQRCCDRIALGQWLVERALAELHARPEALQPDACLPQHFRVDIDGVHASHAIVLKDGFGEGAGTRAQIHYQRRADIGDFVCRPTQDLFIARYEFSDRLVVGVDFKAEVTSHGMAHRLIVAKWSRIAQHDSAARRPVRG